MDWFIRIRNQCLFPNCDRKYFINVVTNAHSIVLPDLHTVGGKIIIYYFQQTKIILFLNKTKSNRESYSTYLNPTIFRNCQTTIQVTLQPKYTITEIEWRVTSV